MVHKFNNVEDNVKLMKKETRYKKTCTSENSFLISWKDDYTKAKLITMYYKVYPQLIWQK